MGFVIPQNARGKMLFPAQHGYQIVFGSVWELVLHEKSAKIAKKALFLILPRNRPNMVLAKKAVFLAHMQKPTSQIAGNVPHIRHLLERPVSTFFWGNFRTRQHFWFSKLKTVGFEGKKTPSNSGILLSKHPMFRPRKTLFSNFWTSPVSVKNFFSLVENPFLDEQQTMLVVFSSRRIFKTLDFPVKFYSLTVQKISKHDTHGSRFLFFSYETSNNVSN